MRSSPTLARYLSRAYLRNLLFMVFILWSIIFMFNTLELMRRATKKDNVPLPLVLQMSLLKLPDTGLQIFTFAILFAAMYTFWWLNRKNELVVVRTAGYSVWQIMAPSITIAALIALFIISIANPFSALLLTRYKVLEADYLTHKHNEIALFGGGLWLRQEQDNDGYIFLHADGIKMPDWHLTGVMALYFDGQDNFIRRVDAPRATLGRDSWTFSDAVINKPGSLPQQTPQVILPTDLTGHDIEESFAAPETMSVWRLPGFIRTVETTGFDATRLRIHFQSLLALPVLYAAMILLAASVSFHPPRFRSTLKLIILGILIGFVTFFTSNFLQALGASHQIPVFLAAWSPAVVMMMLGIAAMLGLEEG